MFTAPKEKHFVDSALFLSPHHGHPTESSTHVTFSLFPRTGNDIMVSRVNANLDKNLTKPAEIFYTNFLCVSLCLALAFGSFSSPVLAFHTHGRHFV